MVEILKRDLKECLYVKSKDEDKDNSWWWVMHGIRNNNTKKEVMSHMTANSHIHWRGCWEKPNKSPSEGGHCFEVVYWMKLCLMIFKENKINLNREAREWDRESQLSLGWFSLKLPNSWWIRWILNWIIISR